MAKTGKKGVEEARNQLPALIEAAVDGRSTIITRRGRPVAALVPVAQLGHADRQQSLLTLKGTGRGLWGTSSLRALRRLRNEWSR